MNNEKLPRLRRRLPLPEDLTKKDSLLARRVTAAAEAFERNPPQALPLIHDVQSQAITLCPHYHPDVHDKSRMMCGAGANGKQPPMGHKCATGGCILSQVILRDRQYVYLGGTSTIEDKLIYTIFTASAGKEAVEY